jgi:hypothetical protein
MKRWRHFENGKEEWASNVNEAEELSQQQNQ